MRLTAHTFPYMTKPFFFSRVGGALVILSGILFLGTPVTYAEDGHSDGSGIMTVSPTSTSAGSTGGTYTFTFTAAELMDSGSISLTIPNGWTTPQLTNGVLGYTTVSGTGKSGDLLDAMDSTSGWSAGNMCGTSFATDATTKVQGTASIKCVNNNESNNDKYYKNITAQNWSGFQTIGFWIRIDSGINNGDLTFNYDDTANLASPIEMLSLGKAVPANTWTYVSFNFGATVRTAIVSYGFQIQNRSNLKNATIWVDDILAGPSISGPTIVGNTITVNALSLTTGQTIIITYGAGGGTSGVTATSTAGTNTFTTKSRISVTGTLTNIVTQPTVVTTASAPTVTNITSSLANGSYKAGQVVPVQVTFSQTVVVTGTPQITLSTGSPATTLVSYSSGSGTNTLTFNYTVAAGNTSADLDYSSTGALVLNGGTIKNGGGTNATLTLPSPGAAGSLGGNKNIVIDTTAPTLATVTPVTSPTNDTTPNYVFSSTEAGTITYGGDCSSSATSTTGGSKTITFNALSAGTHSNCTITVTDAAGNVSSVLNVPSFTIDTTAPTLATVTPVTSPTNDTTPNFTFSSTEAGTITYGGDCSSATSAASSGSNIITFNALSAGAHSNCTITVTDAAGNVSSVLNVPSFTIDTTAPTLATVTPVTSPTNDATPDFVFSSTEAGTITYGGDCSSASTSTTSGNRTITFNALAQGTHSNCTITVTDAAGNVSSVLNVPSFTIDTAAPVLAVVTPVSTPSGDSTPNFTFSTTEAGTISYGGDCSSATTSTTSGNKTVTFNTLAVGTHSNCTITVTDATGNPSLALAVPSFEITPPPPPATKFVILNPADSTAGVATTVTIQAQTASSSVATDYDGAVTIVVNGAATIVGGDPLVTITNGVGTVQVTDTVAQTVLLSLSDTQGTGLNVASTQDVVFSASSLHHFVFNTIADQVAGSAFNVTLTAKDQYGNTVSSFTGTTELSASLGSISPTVTGAFVAGTRTQSVTLTAAGTGLTLTATKTGGSETGLSNAFNVTAGPTSQYVLNDPGDMTAGTRIGYTVTRKDVNGNLVTDGAETVYLYSNSSGTSTFYDSAVNGNAITSVIILPTQSSASFWYYDDGVGTWNITASDGTPAANGAAGITDSTDPVTVSAAPIVATKLTILVQANATVGDTVPVTVRAENAGGQLDTSYTRSNNTIKIYSSGSGTASGGINVSIANGVGIVNMSDTVAETSTISVDDTTNALNDSATAPVVFAAGSVHHFVFDAIGTQAAGVSFPVTITAKDQYGNTATSFTGTTDLTTTAGTISPAITSVFVGGVRTESVTVTTAGTGRTITATRTGGSETGTSGAFDVTAGATAKYTLNDPGDMTAGTRIAYVVTRKDTNGNLVTNGADTAYLYGSSAGAAFYTVAVGGSPVTSVSFAPGNSTVNVWYSDANVGSWTVTASDNVSAPDGSAGIIDASDAVSVNSAPIVATKFIIFGDSSANVGASAHLTVKAVDANLDVQTTFQNDVTVSLSGVGTVVPGGATTTLVDIVNGVGSMDLTSASAGTVTASLSDTQGTGLDISATKNVTFAVVQTGGGEQGATVYYPTGGTAGTGAGPAGQAGEAEIAFSGQAFPSGVTSMFAISDGKIPLKEGQIKKANGKFAVDVRSDLADANQYGIIVYDKNGRPSQAKIFTLNQLTDILKVQDLLISPTIDLTRDIIARGDFVTVIGYAAPGNTLEFEIDGQVLPLQLAVPAGGSYKLLYNTNGLGFGNHSVRVRQVTAKGEKSDYSITKQFELVDYIITAADLNKDGMIDVRDASIFYALWYNPKSPTRTKLDLNGDSKVNLQDFSIFTRTLQKVGL